MVSLNNTLGNDHHYHVCVCVCTYVQQELHMLNNSATSLYEKQTLCINVINQIIRLQQISQCCYLSLP